MHQLKLLLGISILCLCNFSFLVGCAEKKTDEVQIREQIALLQTAIESHDRGMFMDIVDEHYQDQLDNDKKSLQRMLMGFFLRYKDISVYASNTQVELQGIRADADSQVLITGGKNVIPESARHYQVHSCWKKISGEWLLSCLEWE